MKTTLAVRYVYPLFAAVFLILCNGSAKQVPKPTEVFGRIQLVSHFPDVKVKVVDNFPDLKVKRVNAFADATGEWQIVDNFPDFKVQVVETFPDFTIQWVDNFPGVR
ncbi:hypothetical protein P3T73_10655 [Kiritimatiellota bacterium B12222]|nr:hypothetical protein P3T73_10655 [Kiritimatiellota bacterium B12222]